jgi:hypothetical protein
MELVGDFFSYMRIIPQFWAQDPETSYGRDLAADSIIQYTYILWNTICFIFLVNDWKISKPWECLIIFMP